MPSKKPKLQFYADECFPVPVVTYLKSLGYSIIHAYDKNFIQKSDRFHLTISKVTMDKLIKFKNGETIYEKLLYP